jgi:hypothetical protein
VAIPDITQDFGDGTNNHANIERAGMHNVYDGSFGNAGRHSIEAGVYSVYTPGWG